MPAPEPLRKISKSGLKVAAALAFLAPLATRIVIGHGFYAAGHGKWGRMENVISFFSDLGIPYPAANAYFVHLTDKHDVDAELRRWLSESLRA